MEGPDVSTDGFEDMVRMALADPAPGDLFIAAEAVFEIGHLDSELAELISIESAMAGVRGDDNERLTYRVESYTIVIEVAFTERSITGQVLPPVAGTMSLDNSHGETIDTVEVPTQGTFKLRAESGPHRLRGEIRPEEIPPTGFHTHWITV